MRASRHRATSRICHCRSVAAQCPDKPATPASAAMVPCCSSPTEAAALVTSSRVGSSTPARTPPPSERVACPSAGDCAAAVMVSMVSVPSGASRARCCAQKARSAAGASRYTVTGSRQRMCVNVLPLGSMLGSSRQPAKRQLSRLAMSGCVALVETCSSCILDSEVASHLHEGQCQEEEEATAVTRHVRHKQCSRSAAPTV
jgi:hypothetical protein